MGQPKIQISELYIYPIKSLRPLSVPAAQLRREGLRHDRRFMLLKDEGGGRYKNIQTAYFPECTLFHQTLDDDHIVVTYRIPSTPLFPPTPEQRGELRVPLYPAYDESDVVGIKLFGSETTAFRVREPYDAWFSSCFGYPVILVYIGENRRRVLAHSPPAPPRPTKSWLATVASYVPFTQQWPPSPEDEGGTDEEKPDGGLTFNEAAPFLVTSKASLRDVSARLPEGEEMDMIKFRPNIVVDLVPDDQSPPSPPLTPTSTNDAEEGSKGEEGCQPTITTTLKAWDEDFWSELLIGGSHRLALTANCARCVSINIDYGTGRPGTGESGSILKALMRDRRVDAGNKWSPIFGRYAFLLPPATATRTNGAGGGKPLGDDEDDDEEGDDDDDDEDLVADVAVGDEVQVTRRISSRDVWAWPK
ncbi:MOSC domain-containing protein [Annulohypoxylon truncatum]|uniref:MOSC domain-containing protein n=1 Tax=Annulohypoxylon truncatum TaxID=327061 RepID=UPI002008E0E2|nr:MOSC domain-containing protein [Annulohypoxylon truncatum]KAI1210962.1 MOSC domain-containing protein [Annulohypoxylon truncatum]